MKREFTSSKLNHFLGHSTVNVPECGLLLAGYCIPAQGLKGREGNRKRKGKGNGRKHIPHPHHNKKNNKNKNNNNKEESGLAWLVSRAGAVRAKARSIADLVGACHQAQSPPDTYINTSLVLLLWATLISGSHANSHNENISVRHYSQPTLKF